MTWRRSTSWTSSNVFFRLRRFRWEMTNRLLNMIPPLGGHTALNYSLAGCTDFKNFAALVGDDAHDAEDALPARALALAFEREHEAAAVRTQGLGPGLVLHLRARILDFRELAIDLPGDGVNLCGREAHVTLLLENRAGSGGGAETPVRRDRATSARARP